MPSSISCLGKTFATEDERRSYFRDALRIKLPELRNIEGFPIGTDDDILNLSDPPYYTACPNPWLNDFISQWEEEKKELEKKTKRKSVFDVHEPYASDVSEGKNNPIYNAHSYHTKVPHPAIMRYILHYTQPGDIVFDGFAGTGMTGVAAQFCRNPDPETRFKIETEFKKMGLAEPAWGDRKAICGDLSPIASFIAYNYNTPVDVNGFEKEAQRILDEVEAECGWMYTTKHTNGKEAIINFTIWSDVFVCSSCGSEIVFWDVAMDEENDEIRDEFSCPHCLTMQTKRSVEKAIVTAFDTPLKTTIRQPKSVPVIINYTYLGKRYQKKPDAYDLELIKKIDQMDIPNWYPIDPMMGKGTEWGDTWRAGVHEGISHVHHFHIKSCLAGLACFWQKATNESNTRIAKALMLAASAANPNFSKLRRFRSGKKGGGPLAGTLYVASIITPQNPILSIKRNIEFVRKAFNSTRNVFYNCVNQVTSATSCNLKGNSVDYIFTDPPFGENLMYSELNFLWESWLKIKTDNSDEAIQSKAQDKPLFTYHKLMYKCFEQYYSILKPGRWMTVEFSNTSAAVWNGIQTSLQRAGFIIANVAALDKKQNSFKAVTTPTAVKQDLVISCYKPSDEFDEKFRIESGDINVWSFVEEHLKHLPVSIMKEQKVTAVIERSPKILYDRLITFYLMRGLPIPIDAAEFQAKLKQYFIERDEMMFTPEQAAQYENQKIMQGINPQLSLVFDIIYSENDAVEWLKFRLSKAPQKYNEIQPDFRKANTATRKGEKEFELQTLLHENFIPLADGRWRVPDMNEAKDSEHFRIAALLKEFGKYIEELANPKNKKLNDVRVEALRAGFKSSWEKKDFGTIVHVAERIPQNLLMEDEQLLMFYDIARDMV